MSTKLMATLRNDPSLADGLAMYEEAQQEARGACLTCEGGPVMSNEEFDFLDDDFRDDMLFQTQDDMSPITDEVTAEGSPSN